MPFATMLAGSSPSIPSAPPTPSAADALQLAAALDWCDGNTCGESFVCLDDRLRGAAALEGFRVLPYSEEVNEVKVEYAVL